MKNPKVQKLLSNGASWSTMWLLFSQQSYPYDDNFRAVSNYSKNNDIDIGKKINNLKQLVLK